MVIGASIYWLCLLSMLILDALWLSWMKPIYFSRYRKVQCGKPLRVDWRAAIAAYLLMYCGFIWFVLPNVVDKKKEGVKVLNVLVNGFAFGLVVYGVYNATNAAVFEGFDITLAFIDTLWGGVIYSLLSWLAFSLL